MKTTAYIATSLDGFIARENGALDWLEAVGDPISGPEDYGYHAFMGTVDALVMGRNTYEAVRGFGGAWHYGEKPVVVLTTRSLDIPPDLSATVTSMRGTPEEVVRQLATRGARHLYIDGGDTVRRFLRAGLIDRLIISRIPVLIGNGIPLFGPLPHDVRLQHVATRAYPSGLVQSEYNVLSA